MALLCLLGGCNRRTATDAGAHPTYTLGGGYQSGGIWFYPREQFRYDATGLAAIAVLETGLTADGERADAGAMTAGHPTLQLPAVARITNLENGRTVLVRINDRGPPGPARLIALSPRAATVLDAVDGTRVRVELDEAMSHAVAEQTGTAPSLALTAAPVQSVRAEALPPPPGAGQSARVRTAALASAPVATDAPVSAPVPPSFPASYTQGMAEPGRLWLRASEFGRIDYAQRERAQLTGLPVEIEHVHQARQDRFRVRAGPFATVAAADAALRQAINAGVADARIVVE